ncbi:hypothetical protein Pmani_028044 [Petrolisthes manimaculis]|uniref:Uncharacterized protein n=1 Tax=Petrolisthes manimaculis TaxID=1843537 RepID=A0AAE1P2G7_9EUCA|nr:hypothetical protein Pmani_028044 [Petrolisthes manimaculis]
MSSEAGRMCVWVWWAAWLLVASGSFATERESWRQTPQPTTPAQRPWWGATHNVSPAPYPPSSRVTPRRPSPPNDPLLPPADATTHWRRPPPNPRRQQPRHGGWERRPPYTHNSDHGNTRPRHHSNTNPHPLHHHRHHNSLPTNHHQQTSSSPGMGGRAQRQGMRGQRRAGRLVPPLPPPPPPPLPPQPPPRPNIVLIMTDDQDVELGSLNYMPSLMNLVRDEGAFFPNAYCSTPICCPSRSSMLTGLYIHNHEVYTNNHNCSSYHWQQTHERRTFATYLKKAGYRTGYFGKYLNKYNGSHIPEGWDEWSGLLKNSRYYNYTVMRNGHHIKYGDQYPKDYFPHVITNEGMQFLRQNKGSRESPPVLLVLSYPAPHGPEDSAPEHAHRFFNATDHNTMSYNYAPNPDKQWLLQFTGRMHDIEVKFTDVLMTKRLQTLQTVDESVATVIRTLESLGQLDNTYIFYTSDHGYHLGQFGLVKGKSMPFEFDVKVPFLVRGPGIKPGTQMENIALNIDLAPTFLDIAGVDVPEHMDGRSLLPHLTNTTTDVPWRTNFLIESSGRHREEDALELRRQRRRNRAQGFSALGIQGGLYTSKRERLEIICQSEEYQAPCKPGQKWECIQEAHRWRLHKCRWRNGSSTRRDRIRWRRRNCVCLPAKGMGYLVKLDSAERRKQRMFLKKHVTQDLRKIGAKFIKVFNDVDSSEFMETNVRMPGNIHPRYLNTRRRRRSIGSEGVIGPMHEGYPQYDNSDEDEVDAFVKDEEIRDLEVTIDSISDELESLESVSNSAGSGNLSLLVTTPTGEKVEGVHAGCRVRGSAVNCTNDVYHNPQAWRISKDAIDQQIRRLRHQLVVMKDIRKHLRAARPDSMNNTEEYSDYEDEGITATDFQVLFQEPQHSLLPSPATILPPQNINTDMTHGTEEEVTLDNYDDLMNGGTTDESSSPPDDNNEDEDGIIIIGTDYDVGRDSTEEKPVGEVSQEGEVIVEPRNVDEVGQRVEVSRRYEDREMTGHVSHSRRWGVSERGNNKFHLFPVRTPPASFQPHLPTSLLDNETSARPRCWCDLNFRLEQKQAERHRKREDRLRLRLERQRIKQERREMKERKKMRKIKNNLAQCNYTMLNCYTHDNDHWRTPPLWHDGKFCFCMNAVNNTYWCVRTINETHNFLFCEFITGLVTYYDLNIDPYQLRNVAFTLTNQRLAELHHRLESLRTCSGAAQCDNIPVVQRNKNNGVTSGERHEVNNEERNQAKKRRRDEVTDRRITTGLNNMVGVGDGGSSLLLEREERRQIREERHRQREERRRMRKEQKWRRNQVYEERRQVPSWSGWENQQVRRVARKSRMQQRRREKKERRREKRRERKRKKKSKPRKRA